MLKNLGLLTVVCTALAGCYYVQNDLTVEELQAQQETAPQFQPRVKMPSSIVVCRAKQCAPANLSMSKEYVYNTLLHMLDSNAREKALLCTANPNTHSCTEEYVSIPVTVGVTPAYMYLDDVKITDVAISQQNTMALNLILNWGVTYNGQTPTCRPSKTLLYAKNVNNIMIEDGGYTCKMTTVGTTQIKTVFAIDYIDVDYGYIGGFYSIGLSGPAYGGGSGYMIMRLPRDVTLDAMDFIVPATEPAQPAGAKRKDTMTVYETTVAEPKPAQVVAPKPQSTPAVKPVPEVKEAPKPTPLLTKQTVKQEKALLKELPQPAPQPTPQPVVQAQPAPQPTPQPVVQAQPAPQPMPQPVVQAQPAPQPAYNQRANMANHTPAPNVNTIIRYNHAARDFDEAKAEQEKRRREDAKAINYNGVKVFPLPAKNTDRSRVAPQNKNTLSEYNY